MSKFLNISTDTTLGGNSASDDTVSSQKAVKAYVDSQTGTAPAFANITGQPTDNANLATALAGKVPTSRTINSKALTSDITLTASDVGALPDSTVIPTVNDATLTITQGGTTKGTFTANASSNVTIDLDSGGGSSRNIGEIVSSTIPLTDAGLHLLDGALIQGSGSYADFVDYIAGLYNNDPTANYFAQGYTEELAFNQPILSANGTLGGDSFAVYSNNEYSSSYQAYMAFDSSTSSEWACRNNEQPIYIELYNPKPLNITLFTLTNRTTAENISAGTVYGSNDNDTWVEIKTFTNSVTAAYGVWTIDLSDNTNYYKYYKIQGDTYSGNAGFTNIVITATYQGNTYTPEQVWQTAVTTYGVCGKFVYDSVNNTVRLPKITGFTEGTIDPTTLGDLIEAGLPNITGSVNTNAYRHREVASGALYSTSLDGGARSTGSDRNNDTEIHIDASRSSSIYGNSTTVQPQSIKVLYYIVIATSTKTDIEVDIDEIATDLNGKADVDLGNINPSATAKANIVSWGMPDYSAGITKSATSYTETMNGFIVVDYTTDTYSQFRITIDGVEFRFYQGYFGTDYTHCNVGFVPIPKGKQYTINDITNCRVRFFPCIGE